MAGKIEKFKKYLAAVLIVFLMLYNTVLPAVVFAEETPSDPESTVTQAPTSETPVTTVDNTATVENDVQTTSDTGDNIINPTPTPEETIDITDNSTQDSTEQLTNEDIYPTPTSTSDEEQATESAGLESEDNQANSNNDNLTSNSISLANEGKVENDISSDSNTGENKIATPSAEPLVDDSNNSCSVEDADKGGEEIDSGDAVSETVVDNSVNTNSVNSQVIYQTINIFVEENGNLNLSDPFTVASTMIPQYPNDEIINISFVNAQNYAYLNNSVVSYANTGGNTVNSGYSSEDVKAIIESGDAYSIVSLLNKVNFTVINSVVHIVSINIFGKLNGNIILPDFTAASCSDCGMNLVATNSATVVNNVDSFANSGGNTINGNGSIVSGDAASIVNNLNLVNANFVNTAIYGLFINLFGNWFGDFIGWGGFGAQQGGTSLFFYTLGPLLQGGSTNCPICTGDLSIYNSAYVENNINSFANSGGNTINGNGTINSGNAFSVVNLINFVNANFINSVGFFGFLNIFGDWEGDIGGKSEFDALNAKTEDNNNSSDSSNNDNNENAGGEQKQEGGLLSVEQTNNVGEYVLLGDTVTFFVKIKNSGTGKVYGTKLKLFLVKDGVSMGGGLFEIGDIEGGKAVRLSTGLVLSKKAIPGEYIAVALAQGTVGPDNHTVSGQGESSFKIFGKTTVATLSTNTQNPPEVLGSKNFDTGTVGQTREQILFFLLVLTIAAYSSLRVARKRQYLQELFAQGVPFKVRLNTLRMFLL